MKEFCQDSSGEDDGGTAQVNWDRTGYWWQKRAWDWGRKKVRDGEFERVEGEEEDETAPERVLPILRKSDEKQGKPLS